MTIHTLGDNREEDRPSPFSIIKTPDNYVPGNGLLDRYEYMETLSSWIKRHLKSRTFWMRFIGFATLQYFAALVDLGTPFFVLAMLYFMWISMSENRTGIRSAYSVFNKGPNARIHGDLTSKELDRQLRGGF